MNYQKYIYSFGLQWRTFGLFRVILRKYFFSFSRFWPRDNFFDMQLFYSISIDSLRELAGLIALTKGYFYFDFNLMLSFFFFYWYFGELFSWFYFRKGSCLKLSIVLALFFEFYCLCWGSWGKLNVLFFFGCFSKGLFRFLRFFILFFLFLSSFLAFSIT